MLKEILKSFLPWILFFILIGHSQEKLETAIIVATVASFLFDFKRIKKGFILSIGTILFFIFIFVSVVIFKNEWIATYSGFLSNGALAVIAWISILIRKPFTVQYAKETVSSDKWKNPLFIKINYLLTTAWGILFSIGTALPLILLYEPSFPSSVFQIIAWSPVIFGIWFTEWFPEWYKARYFKKQRQPDTEFNPYLQGNFAPVTDELSMDDLKIIGEIPDDLIGIYMRNGPNPAFPPLSYTYPFDGDGMIHAVYIKNGKASYSNKFVETKGLIRERKAGKALYGGLSKLLPMDPEWAEENDGPVAVKNGAFIHVIRFANQYLAMSETAPAYQITSELKTLGEWNPLHTESPVEVGPHTRYDPLTGDLWFINYALTPPFLTIYQFNSEASLVKKWDITKSYPTMIHDFVLTENYVVIFDCPTLFDLDEIMRGGPLLKWKPDLGTRIGIMHKQTGELKWFETEAFFVFHHANAFESESEIAVDLVRHEEMFMSRNEKMEEKKSPPCLYRVIIDLKSGKVKQIALDDFMIEFPRIREDMNSLPYQYVYAPSRTSDITNKRAFNQLIKYDVKNQRSDMHSFGIHAEIGEAVFVPSAASKQEDDGYLILFVFDSTTNQSEFVILDAMQIGDKPLARIAMPRRVPAGLHGSWMPGEW